MEERTKLQKIMLLILTAMIAVFGVLNVVSAFNKGVEFEDTLLEVAESENTTVYFGRVKYEDMEVTVTRSSGTLTEVTFVVGNLIHDICTMETGLPSIRTEHGEYADGVRITKNGEVLFEGGNLFGDEFGWYDKDGKWTAMLEFTANTGRGYWVDNEISVNDIIYFAQGPELVRQGSTGLYFLMVFLTLLLMLDVAFPMVLFQLNHACDVRDPEPSEFYLVMQKVAWVGYPILLLVGYIKALTFLP